MIVSQFTILHFLKCFQNVSCRFGQLVARKLRPSTITQRILRSFQNVLGHGAAGLAKAVIGVSPPYQIGSFFMYIIKRKEEQQQQPKPPRIVPRLPCHGTAACAHEPTSRIPRFRAQIRCLTILKDGPQVAGLESPSYWGCGCPEWRPCCEILKLLLSYCILPSRRFLS
jgi:hypothetical protein